MTPVAKRVLCIGPTPASLGEGSGALSALAAHAEVIFFFDFSELDRVVELLARLWGTQPEAIAPTVHGVLGMTRTMGVPAGSHEATAPHATADRRL